MSGWFKTSRIGDFLFLGNEEVGRSNYFRAPERLYTYLILTYDTRNSILSSA